MVRIVKIITIVKIGTIVTIITKVTIVIQVTIFTTDAMVTIVKEVTIVTIVKFDIIDIIFSNIAQHMSKSNLSNTVEIFYQPSKTMRHRLK